MRLRCVVIERTSEQSLDGFLRTKIFERLQLEMTAEPKTRVTHRAHSYQSAGLDFEEVTFDIYALGPVRSLVNGRRPG